MTDTSWYVVEYPSKEANEGRVLWDTEDVYRPIVILRAEALQRQNPDKDYDVSDLPELLEVYTRDVLPQIQGTRQ